MKFKHVVLFGVVASIMSYLNSAMETENEPDKQETILNELKDLIDNKLEDIDIDKKLEELKEEVPEHFEKATEMAKDVTDNLIEELNSIVASLGEITTSAVDSFVEDENTNVEETQEVHIEELTTEENLEDTAKEEVIEDVQEEFEDISELLENQLEATLELNEDEELETCDDVCEEIYEELPTDEGLEVKEETDTVKEELINELESLLASLELNEDEAKETSEKDFSEDDYLSQIKDAINNTIILEENEIDEPQEEVKEETREIDQDEIDAIFSEILRQEGLIETEKEDKEEVKTDYLDELVDELNAAMDDSTNEETSDSTEELEEENSEDILEDSEETLEETVDIYAQINELYPYLSRGFVRAVYDLKEAIACEYPINHRIIILHRLSFNNLEDLRQFAEIVLNHDYRVNVDENKMIVDIFKEVINTDGKILTNIFEIANQAKLLEGNYEGYRIELI